MGFLDMLFGRPKTFGERVTDIVTRGDFSSRTTDGKKVAAVAASAAGAVVAGTAAAANVSHGQSALQDAAARSKKP
jgi:hypothetical protein